MWLCTIIINAAVICYVLYILNVVTEYVVVAVVPCDAWLWLCLEPSFHAVVGIIGLDKIMLA